MSGQLDSLSDEALARMARSGDRAAFETLCERCLPAVYNRLRALLPSEAVEDVTQEVFIAALKSIRRYRGQALFCTWLSAIARHKVADFYRGRSRRPETDSLDAETGDPASAEPWEECAVVRVALGKLPLHYQEVLLLRFAEGLSFEQIARATGDSLEAVKSRYRRAVAAMAQEMQEAG